MKLKMIEMFEKNNNCYKSGKTITVTGLMVHSTAVNKVNPEDWAKIWDVAQPGGRDVCVHGFLGRLKDGSLEFVQTLPWTMRGWHAGGSANNSHIGVEICEDDTKDEQYCKDTYEALAELYAMLCTKFKLNPLQQGVIIGHYEGYKTGVASNHADPQHWWSKYGLTMNGFRQRVSDIMKAGVDTVENPVTGKEEAIVVSEVTSPPIRIVPYMVKVVKGHVYYKGAGKEYGVSGTIKEPMSLTITEEKLDKNLMLWGKLKSGAGWIPLI